ncbi:hypothetical protein SAMN04487968_101238 [Nocardioides terrae]|uniref:Uncharacterized protein n=1 Tax=Nocardioides terrae TaxID=574651 RepID=A0A1I1DHL8_9ACTN|nr:PPA1309 family protein [Nocardioides terrae]SFB73916.1 hypothetical protein SAMN04487968_101238 [Nocardioides terrae]
MSLDITDIDPALAAAVLELETHASGQGWDQPATLYALVDTASLVAKEPALAALMGLDDASAQGSLTPVEQEQLTRPLEEALPTIIWPDGVVGCAAVVERLVLPPGVDADIPADPAAADAFARQHPDRQDVRMVVGVTRAGASYCALRLRTHDTPEEVVAGDDLVPQLVELLRGTLEDDGAEAEDGQA